MQSQSVLLPDFDWSAHYQKCSVYSLRMQHYKMADIQRMQARGVLRETTPSQSGWHFEVLKPDELTVTFRDEYAQFGELRW